MVHHGPRWGIARAPGLAWTSCWVCAHAWVATHALTWAMHTYEPCLAYDLAYCGFAWAISCELFTWILFWTSSGTE